MNPIGPPGGPHMGHQVHGADHAANKPAQTVPVQAPVESTGHGHGGHGKGGGSVHKTEEVAAVQQRPRSWKSHFTHMQNLTANLNRKQLDEELKKIIGKDENLRAKEDKDKKSKKKKEDGKQSKKDNTEDSIQEFRG